MNQKKPIIYLFALSIFFLFGYIGCKKYPEGGFIYRNDKRIIGNWKLKLYEVNGIDSTALINYNGNENYKNIMFIEEDTKYNPTIYCQIDRLTESTIAFNNDNNTVNFREYNGPGVGKQCVNSTSLICYKHIFNPEQNNTVWNILKIKRNEIKLTCNNTSHFVIILVR